MKLTIFTIAKPFTDPQIALIQRNAIQSWQQIAPQADVEILVFGDREGVAEACSDLGVTHVKKVKRGATDYDLMSDAFAKATRKSKADLLCYVNGDMLLPPDFAHVLSALDGERFLVTGERTDAEITTPIDFAEPNWWAKAKARVIGSPGACSMDYFVFKRGEFVPIPEIVAGAWYSDNYLVGTALSLGVPVVDATAVITALHQNHDHAAKGGLKAWSTGPESLQAKAALPDGKVCNLEHATVRLKPGA